MVVSFSPKMPAGRMAQVSIEEGEVRLYFKTDSSASAYYCNENMAATC